jgi:hypothetical protein
MFLEKAHERGKRLAGRVVGAGVLRSVELVGQHRVRRSDRLPPRRVVFVGLKPVAKLGAQSIDLVGHTDPVRLEPKGQQPQVVIP